MDTILNIQPTYFFPTKMLQRSQMKKKKSFTWVNCWTKVHCNDKLLIIRFLFFFFEHPTGEWISKPIVVKYKGEKKNPFKFSLHYIYAFILTEY